jgi:hypothetical protein
MATETLLNTLAVVLIIALAVLAGEIIYHIEQDKNKRR